MAAGSARLAEAHRVAQTRLGADTVRILRATFPLLDLENLDASTARWLRVVVPTIRAQHTRSAQLASAYVRSARALDLPLSTFTPPLATVGAEQIATSMTVTGPVEARRLTALQRSIPEVRDRVFVSTARAGMRLAMNGGRDTVQQSVAADDQAVGFARVGSGHSCAFCSMLISRGPVYSRDSVDFRAHDGCSCGSMPVYRAGEGWTEQAEALRVQWTESTAGLGGQDAVNAFRRTVESTAA